MSTLRETLLQLSPKWLLDLYFERRAKAEYRKWEKEQKPIPPPHAVKKFAIRDYQKQSGVTTLIETGTYHGAMVFAQLDYFDTIYSIELAEGLYNKAVKRFKKYNKVHLYKGDSANELGNIIKQLTTPAIFWLDGHYSGGETEKGETDCPIWGELEHITHHNLPHIILIDDARCFVGENDYPTIKELRQYFINNNINCSFEVKDDIIRVLIENRKL